MTPLLLHCFSLQLTRQQSVSAKRKISIRSRKSGISGIIKRTRSIQVDQYDPGKLLLFRFLLSLIKTTFLHLEIMSLRASYEARNQLTPESASNPISPVHEPVSLYPDEYESEMPSFDHAGGSSQHINKINKLSDLTITEDLTDDELVNMYKDSEVLEEQADILHYLFYNKGLDFKTGRTLSNGSEESVRDMLKEVYEKACTEKRWALVRHSAGMLGKQVEDLSKSVADLLVRQKQITVGMPPQYEQVSEL